MLGRQQFTCAAVDCGGFDELRGGRGCGGDYETVRLGDFESLGRFGQAARRDGRVARYIHFIFYFSTICIHTRRFSTSGRNCITRGTPLACLTQLAPLARWTRETSVAWGARGEKSQISNFVVDPSLPLFVV